MDSDLRENPSASLIFRELKSLYYVGQLDLRHGPIFVVHRYSFHSIKGRVSAVDDLAEDGVFPVQMSLLRVSYEKLRLVRIWSRVGHCYDPSRIELRWIVS
jgi:hypothetical protein